MKLSAVDGDFVVAAGLLILSLAMFVGFIAILAPIFHTDNQMACRDGLVVVQHETYSEIKNPLTFCTEIDK